MIFAPNDIKGFIYTPGKHFLIPEFQRPYSWEIDNIKTFLADLEELNETTKNHYFGTVVYVNDTSDMNASAIIDGQQRVTTTLLMIMAIYHHAKENPDTCEMPAGDISNNYLFNSSEYSKEENRIKLRTVTTDNVIFEKLYEQKELTSEEKQNKLFKAYTYFYEYFESRQNLEKYIMNLSRFKIMSIALDASDDNPQRVFESINSTGKPLTDGDKIRNFALMLNSDQVRKHVYEKYWQQIEQELTDANKDYITDFFRSYIISRNCFYTVRRMN